MGSLCLMALAGGITYVMYKVSSLSVQVNRRIGRQLRAEQPVKEKTDADRESVDSGG